MKIVNWKNMMKEPIGTIFQEYKYGDLGSIRVFGGPITIDNPEKIIDYCDADLFPQWIHSSFWDTDKSVSMLNKLAPDTSSMIAYPIGFGRDALYDESRFYLVWEMEDRKKFAEWLLDPEKCADEMNEDPMAMISANKASTGEEL